MNSTNRITRLNNLIISKPRVLIFGQLNPYNNVSPEFPRKRHQHTPYSLFSLINISIRSNCEKKNSTHKQSTIRVGSIFHLYIWQPGVIKKKKNTKISPSFLKLEQFKLVCQKKTYNEQMLIHPSAKKKKKRSPVPSFFFYHVTFRYQQQVHLLLHSRYPNHSSSSSSV